MDFKENSPFQEGVISEMYQRPDKSYFQEPQDLDSLLNTGRLVQKFLLKQADVDKILKMIQGKVLKRTQSPVTVKEIQAGYSINPYLKDLYLYLTQNKLPSTKTAIHEVEMLAENIYYWINYYLNWLQHQKKKWHYWPYHKYVQIR